MAPWTASAKWGEAPALDGQGAMPLGVRLSEWLGHRCFAPASACCDLVVRADRGNGDFAATELARGRGTKLTVLSGPPVGGRLAHVVSRLRVDDGELMRIEWSDAGELSVA